MDGNIALALDVVPDWWGKIAVGAVALVGGLILNHFLRRWRIEDEQAKKDRAALEAELVGLASRLNDEARERRDAISEEARVRRDKDDSLGKDISRFRQEFAYYCGKTDKDRPRFDSGDG